MDVFVAWLVNVRDNNPSRNSTSSIVDDFVAWLGQRGNSTANSNSTFSSIDVFVSWIRTAPRAAIQPSAWTPTSHRPANLASSNASWNPISSGMNVTAAWAQPDAARSIRRRQQEHVFWGRRIRK
ncbi:hypothetical protein PF005_g27730 [Phytophthora fragariae]|uniref:Uncharacterized protein n=1 Tax=Phytophthora fragariae TaxID=53985 RepID=A0A6A3QB02_9STRA|nr:hypothetical protein PF003_g30565 [Phytophthora fragariae]KAE8919103.1 hypothetical protein PF009_g30584 [Phytophthora fragariae]KAE8962627.1 hypothetical protein PF011_g29314 [Phytophthora fragariae]KAE9068697.1 hypothetical protein PF010_g26963 [Phytophthora fragariae]KAE9069965.1 hypothetical protein PF006_g29457 [Phytophthora fragariae]